MMARASSTRYARCCRRGCATSPTAGKALGYAQLLAVLADDGAVTGDLDAAVAATARAPGGSCAGSGPGSAATRASAGSTRADPDLVAASRLPWSDCAS